MYNGKVKWKSARMESLKMTPRDFFLSGVTLKVACCGRHLNVISVSVVGSLAAAAAILMNKTLKFRDGRRRGRPKVFYQLCSGRDWTELLRLGRKRLSSRDAFEGSEGTN